MDVHVDAAGEDVAATRIDLAAATQVCADLDDLLALDAHVAAAHAARRDDRAALDDQIKHRDHPTDRAATGRALDEILLLPTGVFNPNEAQLLGPLADALLEMDRADDLRRLIQARRPAVERFNASWVLGVVALIEARLAAHNGDRETAAAKLDEALRLAESEPNAVGLRRVLEARVEFFNRAEDRAALRQLCERIAAGLPDDLRTIFLNSPRVAPIIGTPA